MPKSISKVLDWDKANSIGPTFYRGNGGTIYWMGASVTVVATDEPLYDYPEGEGQLDGGEELYISSGKVIIEGDIVVSK